MRALRTVVAGLLLLGLPAAAAADHHESALMKKVADIGDHLAKALVENNVDAMLAMYTEDAISLPNFGPRMQGIATFKQHHQEMTTAGMKIHSFESDPTEVWEAGNHVIEIGTYSISLDMPGMTGIQDHGKYLTVYVKGADGSLKIKAEIWNTDMNPMEMGAAHGHGESQ